MKSARRSSGFGETPPKEYEARHSASFEPVAKRETVRLGEGGRFVIPAAMREAMGVKPGDTLVMKLHDGELRVTGFSVAIKRAQALFKAVPPKGDGVVDTFLAERRKEQRDSDDRFERLHAEGRAKKGAGT